jgi:hypothetical protein
MKNLLLVKDLKGDIKYHPSGEKNRRKFKK